MREFVFQGINSAWERSFVFDSIRELTIGNLKDLIRSTNCDFEKSQQLLVYEGCVLQSDSFLLADLLGDDDSNPITFRVFSIQTDQHVANVSMDPLSIAAAKEYFARTQHNMCYCTDNACSDKNFCSDVTAPDPSLLTWKALVDTLSVPINNETDNNPFSADGTTATAAVPETVGGVANPEVAPAPAAVAVPAPGAVAAPGPVLPVVNWLQWGVMAKLILVSLLFTYNRNLSTERLVHMAAMTVFSYLFQIGALTYWATWVCFLLGFDANPPPRPQPHPNNNNNADANDENPQGDENIYNNDDDSNNEDANDINNDIVGGNDAANGVPVAAQAVAQNNMLNGARNNAPNRAQRNARGAAAAPAPPFNLVRWLNAVYHSGFTIPTTPGILMDVLSLFMGLFFSIVPAWVPYRL